MPPVPRASRARRTVRRPSLTAVPIGVETFSIAAVTGNERDHILSIGGGLSSTAVTDLKPATTGVKSGAELRALVAEKKIPGAVDDARIVRSLILSSVGPSLLREEPKLDLAILHEVYARAGAEALKERKPLDRRTIKTEAATIVAELAPKFVKEKIKDTLADAGLKASKVEIEQIAEEIDRQPVAFDSPRIDRVLFDALKKVKREQQFEPFFEVPDVTGTKSIEAELGKLTPERRRAAIRVLEELGIDPKKVKEDREDWARVAIALSAGDGISRDIALAAYTPDTAFLDLESDLDLPEFETADVTGLLPENISTCADLYYVHMFDKLGTYRAVDALAVRFFDRINLGLSDTARKLYVYIKRRSDRIPAEDRRRITDRIFEGGPDGRSPFKLLMGQMVESLIEYARIRNAGELLASGGVGLGGSTAVGTRSSVRRSIENLQRYLSRAGGGMSPFLAKEAGKQLMDCFEILDSPELKAYFGGDFTEGMWSIIETVIEDVDGRPAPPADRMRTLAVHGRRVMRFLADNANNVGALSDDDLDVLAEHVQNWLAAFRRPEINEAEWLEDEADYDEEEEESPAEEAVDEALREAREPDVLEVE
jgi:hypothetical protein